VCEVQGSGFGVQGLRGWVWSFGMKVLVFGIRGLGLGVLLVLVQVWV
jgi:hypothetical protein